ncbi:MAG: FMN-binding protein [Candidatus Limnocylindrales bacterium]
MLPRRAVVALATTAIGLTLLLNFKTPPGPATGTTAVALGRPATPGTLVPSASAVPGAATPPAGVSPAATAQPAQGQSPAPSPASAAQGSPLKAGQFAGPVVQIPFGNVQVQVTIRGGRIVDIQPLQMPAAHALSQQIAQYAAPILREEALQAQSAQIDLVSGATYTSEAYAQSLQGAIDQALA